MTEPRIGPLRNNDLKKAILDYVKDLDEKDLVIDENINPFVAIVCLSWIGRYIVVDKMNRYIISDAGGWGFKSLDSAMTYIVKTLGIEGAIDHYIGYDYEVYSIYDLD